MSNEENIKDKTHVINVSRFLVNMLCGGLTLQSYMLEKGYLRWKEGPGFVSAFSN